MRVAGRGQSQRLRTGAEAIFDQWVLDALEERGDTCSLDVADRGAQSVQKVAEAMAVSVKTVETEMDLAMRAMRDRLDPQPAAPDITESEDEDDDED